MSKKDCLGIGVIVLFIQYMLYGPNTTNSRSVNNIVKVVIEAVLFVPMCILLSVNAVSKN